MPDMDGVELCRRLSEEESTSSTPVILLTARTGDEARIQAREAGAVAFLTKPCEEEELLATVRALIKKRTQSVNDAAQYEMNRTAFVAEGIAHEIRNPLGFVMNAQFLLTDVAQRILDASDSAISDSEREQLRTIVNQARDSGRQGIDRINNMVNQVAALGDQGLMAGVCEPKDVASEVHCLVKPKLGDRELNLNLAPGYAAISAGLLHDVILNLVKNALDALGDSAGEVSIEGSQLGETYELVISDNGPGIDDHIRDQVFQPFFTTKAPGEGTGLGLAISRQKIVQAKGEIVLRDSVQGCCFVINLPAAMQESTNDRAA